MVLKDDGRVLPANRKTILEFLQYAEAEGLSAPRRVRYTIVLRKPSKLLRMPFRRADKKDMVRVSPPSLSQAHMILGSWNCTAWWVLLSHPPVRAGDGKLQSS